MEINMISYSEDLMDQWERDESIDPDHLSKWEALNWSPTRKPPRLTFGLSTSTRRKQHFEKHSLT